MFSAQLDITYAIFLSLLLGSMFIFVIGLAVVTRASIFTRVDLDLIIPMIVVLSVLGGFTLESTFTNVYYLIVLGIIGYFMKKYDYSIVAFVLGAILGPIAEENLWRSLQISNGSWEIFIASPISAILVVAILAVLFGPMVKKGMAT
jgi:putative tricarboxylic transport membrane protein